MGSAAGVGVTPAAGGQPPDAVTVSVAEPVPAGAEVAGDPRMEDFGGYSRQKGSTSAAAGVEPSAVERAAELPVPGADDLSVAAGQVGATSMPRIAIGRLPRSAEDLAAHAVASTVALQSRQATPTPDAPETSATFLDRASRSIRRLFGGDDDPGVAPTPAMPRRGGPSRPPPGLPPPPPARPPPPRRVAPPPA